MSKKNVVLMEFEGNPNVGIYIFANDKFCLVGKRTSEEKKKEIEKVLEVPVYGVSVLETDLLGIFLAGNNDVLITPELFDYEREEISKICEEHEVKFVELRLRLNTLGNNICVGDKKLLINPEYSKRVKEVFSEEIDYEVIEISNPKFNAIGSICKFANGKYFLSQELEEEEVDKIVDEVGGVGTVNSGSNFTSSGIVANSKGLILGSMCSTVEIQNVVESLDYL